MFGKEAERQREKIKAFCWCLPPRVKSVQRDECEKSDFASASIQSGRSLGGKRVGFFIGQRASRP